MRRRWRRLCSVREGVASCVRCAHPGRWRVLGQGAEEGEVDSAGAFPPPQAGVRGGDRHADGEAVERDRRALPVGATEGTPGTGPGGGGFSLEEDTMQTCFCGELGRGRACAFADWTAGAPDVPSVGGPPCAGHVEYVPCKRSNRNGGEQQRNALPSSQAAGSSTPEARDAHALRLPLPPLPPRAPHSARKRSRSDRTSAFARRSASPSFSSEPVWSTPRMRHCVRSSLRAGAGAGRRDVGLRREGGGAACGNGGRRRALLLWHTVEEVPSGTSSSRTLW